MPPQVPLIGRVYPISRDGHGIAVVVEGLPRPTVILRSDLAASLLSVLKGRGLPVARVVVGVDSANAMEVTVHFETGLEPGPDDVELVHKQTSDWARLLMVGDRQG